MAASITEQLLAFFAAALTEAAPEGATVARGRRRPSSFSELPMILVRPTEETVEKAFQNATCPIVQRTLTVAVLVRCAGDDQDLDALRSLVLQTIMADMSAGGLAIEVTERQHTWSGEEATEADYVEDEILFDVRYKAARQNPEKTA